MLKDKIALRIVGPTFLVAVLLLGACATTVIYLIQQQAASANLLRENVGSRRVAQELETSMGDLLALLRTGDHHVDALDDRIRSLLAEARKFADKPEEQKLVNQLDQSFTTYLELRRQSSAGGPPGAEEPSKSALQIMESEALPVCRDLRRFNGLQIEHSEELHRQTLTGMAWGLAGVGLIGAFAGIFLGYGAAHGLRRSIYQLSIRIRDAADRLGQELPTVTLTQDGDFPELHGQMERLIGEIERVVQQLQQREHEVLRADQMRAVGQLAAGTAHELRNPLTAIKMLIQTHKEEAAENGLPAEDLYVIEQEVRRMERCLHTFLNYARPPKLEHRPFDLATVVAKTFALLESRARHQRIAHAFYTSRSCIHDRG